ncbi:NAD(P)-dependent oxidoreductase [Mycolicibacterium sp. XJ1819]
MSRIGFVGAGRMGAPMIRRLVESGHQVRAHGRSDAKCGAVRDLGADAVTEVSAVAEGADVVIVCVFTDEQVRQVCLSDGLTAAMAPGTALVLHTTGSPGTAAQIARRALSVDVLDAPVSGGPHDIDAGAITLFVGASDEAFARVRPVLAGYGDPILHVGPVGSGQSMKLVNNSLFAAQIGLLRATVTLAERLGVAEADALRALPHGSGTSRVVEMVSARGSVSAFVDEVGQFIGKDVAVVRETVAELGADLGLLDDVIDNGIGP